MGNFILFTVCLFIRHEAEHVLTMDRTAAAPKPYLHLWFSYADKRVGVQYPGLELYSIFLGGKYFFTVLQYLLRKKLKQFHSNKARPLFVPEIIHFLS